MNILYFLFDNINGGMIFMDNSRIKCTVKDCKHHDGDCKCVLSEIKVCHCADSKKKEATMCDSYKKLEK